MKTPQTSVSVFVVAWTIALTSAHALIMTGRNEPVRDAGWPEGSLALANLQSRVGWWEGPPFGGGQWQFLYRGDAEAFAQALEKFSAIRAPELELVIHDGPHENQFLKNDRDATADTRVDWTFMVWVPANWNHLFNNPKLLVLSANQREFRRPVDPPRLDVYLGGQVDWAKVTVPKNVRVRDERAATLGVDLSGGSIIRAEIYDMDNGKPVKGARLVVEKMSWQAGTNAHWESEPFVEALSDSAGLAQIDKIPTNQMRVRVVAEGYATRWLDQRARLRPEFMKFTVELARPGSLRGMVTDLDGKPVKGVKVRPSAVLGSNGRGYPDGRDYEPFDAGNVETDAEGRFELKGLPVGYAQLHASAPGYHFSDLITIYTVPETNIVLRIAGAGTIAVAITAKDGTPIARFGGKPLIVALQPKEGSKVKWSGSATVKDDGTYDFRDVPPGEYVLTSRPNPGSTKQKYTPDRAITVTPGTRTPVTMIYE